MPICGRCIHCKDEGDEKICVKHPPSVYEQDYPKYPKIKVSSEACGEFEDNGA